MKFISARITLFTFLFVSYNAERISLRGNWDAHTLEGDIHFIANVPGGVYTDLLQAGLLPENLVGDNDVKNRWVSAKVINFAKSFEVDETLLQSRNVMLTLHGVDTFSTVMVNGVPIFDTTNMFVRYQHTVEKKYLQLGTNEIKVTIFSPTNQANVTFDEQSSNYVVPPECVPEIYNGECHVNHIRKMQASFSWDWGPAFPSMGIWKDVELESFDDILLNDATAHIYYKENNIWAIMITVFFTTATEEQHNATVFGQLRSGILVNDDILIQNASNVVFSLNGQSASASITLTVNDDQIDRWWPNGYGNQTLYLLEAEIVINEKIIRRDFSVGFRTVELVQETLVKGESFYFKINDIPIFAKGSNWIPSSIFPELSSDTETIDHLLRSAKDAHMNMLRVWGGGYYESDLFYKLADKYGIMIWQDFMFACGMYPTNKEFLDSVREEVRQNVIRLQHHPSLVIWAGNNENEAALYGNWYGTRNQSIYKEDYVKLYVDTIKNEFKKFNPITPFVVSSPSDGDYTERHNYLGPNPYSNLYGDVHYYNYVLNGWDSNQYPRTRFASEYGVQSIPSIATLRTGAAGEEDLKINSKFMKHRQHLLGGYEGMEHLISMNLKIPENNNSTNDFINYIYLTQINQAVSIKVQTEFYRQSRSDLNSLGEGMTMGALYWQINDVWQAPSWSSIEFGGRWKMLHYYAVEFFAPIIITPHVTPANEVKLYIVSDKLIQMENCSFTINTYKWNSLTPIYTQNHEGIIIPPNAATIVASFWLNDYLHRAGCGGLASMKKECVLEFVLKNKKNKIIAPFNYVYPAPLKTVALPSVTINVKVDPIPACGTNSINSEYIVELRSEGIALFVWLDFGSNLDIHGRFSGNGFHMFHGIKTVVFHPKGETTVEEIRDNLRVTTLSDIYKSGRELN